jgi:hypothetical protein
MQLSREERLASMREEEKHNSTHHRQHGNGSGSSLALFIQLVFAIGGWILILWSIFQSRKMMLVTLSACNIDFLTRVELPTQNVLHLPVAVVALVNR